MWVKYGPRGHVHPTSVDPPISDGIGAPRKSAVRCQQRPSPASLDHLVDMRQQTCAKMLLAQRRVSSIVFSTARRSWAIRPHAATHAPISNRIESGSADRASRPWLNLKMINHPQTPMLTTASTLLSHSRLALKDS